jgi:hypothetical protein
MGMATTYWAEPGYVTSRRAGLSSPSIVLSVQSVMRYPQCPWYSVLGASLLRVDITNATETQGVSPLCNLCKRPINLCFTRRFDHST